jgi:KaiC/GvpD/RAD55 family RecA-like ATPase
VNCGLVRLGVSVLDKVLPRGVPRRSVLLLAGSGGTGKSALTSLISWSFTSRGEKVIYVALDDDPLTVVEGLSFKGLNAHRLVDEEKLLIVDAYSSRYGIEPDIRVEESLTTLDLTVLLTTIRRVVERKGLTCTGLVVLDSLNALLLRFEASMVLDFVNALRASIAKRHGVLTVLTLHTPTQLLMEIASSLEYMVDVVVWLRYHAEALEAGYAVRELLVKKAKGVPVIAGWVKFIITDEGVVEAEVRRKGRETSSNVEVCKSVK